MLTNRRDCGIIKTKTRPKTVKGGYAITFISFIKGGDDYGICVHNDFYYRYDNINIIHKKITRL